MQSNKIYHYKNSFNVSFLIFKFKNIEKYILLGLIWIKDPMSQCNEMLLNLNIKISKLPTLKQYLLKIPICHHVKAQKMCRLAIRF